MTPHRNLLTFGNETAATVPGVLMTQEEAARLSDALRATRGRLRGLINNVHANRMASDNYRTGEVATLQRQLTSLDEFHRAHYLAHSLDFLAHGLEYPQA